MSEKTKKPEPTRFDVRITNAATFEIETPISGSGRLSPGESVEFTGLRKSQLAPAQSNRFLEVEIIGDDSDQLAVAEAERDRGAKNARDRLAALSKTVENVKHEEREIEARLAEVEETEKRAESEDLAALREAGSDPEKSATAVLIAAGSGAEERRGLVFDQWGVQLRRLEAEAVHAEIAAVVAEADEEEHRAKIREAEAAVETAKKELADVRNERDRMIDHPMRLRKQAKALRRQAAELEASGPVRVA